MSDKIIKSIINDREIKPTTKDKLAKLSHSEIDKLLYTIISSGLTDYASSLLDLIDDKCEFKTIHDDGNGRNLLNFVCYHRLEPIALKIIKKKVDINQPDANGENPLTYACWSSLNNLALKLISDEKCNIDYPNSNGNSPLLLAVSTYKSANVVLELIKSNRVNVKSKGSGGTPLSYMMTSQPFYMESIVKILELKIYTIDELESFYSFTSNLFSTNNIKVIHELYKMKILTADKI